MSSSMVNENAKMRKSGVDEWEIPVSVQETLVPFDFHPLFLAFSSFGFQIVQLGFKNCHVIAYLCIEAESNEFSKCHRMFRDLLSCPRPNRQRFHI